MSKNKIFKLSVIILSIIVLSVTSITTFQVAYAAKKAKAPVITRIVSTDKYVKLTWKDGNQKGTSSHYIYRKVGNGSYKRIAKLSKTASSYVDNGIKTGKNYYYKVSNKGVYGNYIGDKCKVKPVKIASPKLSYVKRYSKNSKEYAKFAWNSKSGQQYYVYRKPKGEGKWSKIATVTAKGNLSYFTDKNLKKSANYIYTCKVVKKSDKIVYNYGSYDSGISTVAGKPEVSADCQNLKAIISWNSVSGANLYKVYRKVGVNGEYRLIGETSDTTYVDVYKQSAVKDAERKYLCAETFVDPSINPFVYTVRAVNVSNNKESYSDYLRDGDFHIETPSIVSIVKNNDRSVTYEWATLSNAKGYYLYTGYYDAQGSFHWKRVADVKPQKTTRQKATVKVDPSHTYFTVKARFEKEGKTVYSQYDKKFNIQNRKYQNQNILYIGDSITFGSPYKGITTREVFSYPWRVQQLTGVNTYNPSIPGATYAYNERKDRYRMVTDVAKKFKNEKALHSNTKTYKDFDVVVMAAGTNDYSDNTSLGQLDSTDIKEFNGAVNQIMEWIREGSEQRIEEGKEPIKIVFVELFYSDRTKIWTERNNRFVTENELGLTLTDYQDNYNSLIDKYRSEGFDVYQFDTTQFVNESTCPYVTSDNLHMSRYTYSKIGNELAKFLVDNNIIESR